MFFKGSGGLKSMFFEAISAAQKSAEKHIVLVVKVYCSSSSKEPWVLLTEPQVFRDTNFFLIGYCTQIMPIRVQYLIQKALKCILLVKFFVSCQAFLY